MDLHKPASFTESQNFRRTWWLWIVLIAAFSVIFVTFFMVLPEMPISSMIGIIVAPILSILLLWVLQLKTELSEQGISYQFFFLHLRARKISWDQIEHAYIRQYKPLAEYGGWGLRWSFRGYGQAVNVGGNKGLQLIFKDGKKLLLGTQQPEQMLEALKKLGKYMPPKEA